MYIIIFQLYNISYFYKFNVKILKKELRLQLVILIKFTLLDLIKKQMIDLYLEEEMQEYLFGI